MLDAWAAISAQIWTPARTLIPARILIPVRTLTSGTKTSGTQTLAPRGGAFRDEPGWAVSFRPLRVSMLPHRTPEMLTPF